MSSLVRTGPFKSLRSAATFAANGTWYDCTSTITVEGNCLKLFLDVAVATADSILIKLAISEDGTNFYEVHSGEGLRIWTLDGAVGSRIVELDGVNLSPYQQVKVSFKALVGAASATVGIKALSFISSAPNKLAEVQEISGYSSYSDSNRVTITNPDRNHCVSQLLCNVTNQTDGTLYYYLDCDSFRQVGAQLTIGAGSGSCTVTVEGSLQDDGTASASCSYIDVSTAVYGSANWTASAILTDSNKVCGQFKYMRFKAVYSTGGANDADLTIRVREVY